MENEQKTTKIRWEGDNCYVGKVCVASMHFDLMPQVWKIAIGRKIASVYLPAAEARAWVERYLGVEEEKAVDTKEWYDPASGYLLRSVDGVITERRLFTEWEPVNSEHAEEPKSVIDWSETCAYVGGLVKGYAHCIDGHWWGFVVENDGSLTAVVAGEDFDEAKGWVSWVLGGRDTLNGPLETKAQPLQPKDIGKPTKPQPLIQWIDGEAFVDGVFRATVEKSAITHTNAGEKREKPLFRAFVIREDGVQSKAANCLDELAAKRWCERMILGEG